MSGPKVVRIVTREEILEICLEHLAQVEAALAEWERIGSRNNVIDAQDRARRAGEFKQLKELIEKDRFMELQKRAPLLLHSLRLDMSQPLSSAFRGCNRYRRREDFLRHAARQLQRQLQDAGAALPDELREGLKTAASNRQSSRAGRPRPRNSSGASLLSSSDGSRGIALHSGKDFILVRHRLQLSRCEHILDTLKAVGRALLGELHAVFWTILAVGADDGGGRWQAHTLIGSERLDGISVLAQRLHQGINVENGLARAVGADRIHGVGRISQQRHPAMAPARQGLAIDHRIFEDSGGARDQARNVEPVEPP